MKEAEEELALVAALIQTVVLMDLDSVLPAIRGPGTPFESISSPLDLGHLSC